MEYCITVKNKLDLHVSSWISLKNHYIEYFMKKVGKVSMQHYDNYDSLINTYIIYECIMLIYEYSVCVYTRMYTYTYTNLSNTT